MKKNKIYIVHWTDASTVNDETRSWLDEDTIKQKAREKFNSKNIDVGFILEKNKDFLIIAGSSDGCGEYSSITMIPIEMVEKIKELK